MLVIITGAVALILLIVFLVIIIWWVGTYNMLQRLKYRAENAWAQIDVQLKRRHDLIPNLVEAVKSFAKHEKETLEAVIKARNIAINPNLKGSEKVEAEGALSGALSRLLVSVEQYPDLKADQNFLSFQEELTSTENKLSFARQAYNDAVMAYNMKIKSMPSNIVANTGSFTSKEMFELVDSAEREVPEVKFGN
jgi:LemA protein